MENVADHVELVDRARRGDAAAWEALYRRAYPRLVAFARRRLDPDAAMEAVSETMVRAVAGLDRFQWQGQGFDAWLFSILRHVIADGHRRAARRRAAAPEPAAPDYAGPLDHVIGVEEAVAVRRAFARLKPFERDVLELRVVAGLSSDEVAAVVGKRAGAVRMAQARALTRMRAWLGETP